MSLTSSGQARRLRLVGADMPGVQLAPIAHTLGSGPDASLAVFLPGPATTHILAGPPRWVFEQISAQASLSESALLGQAAHASIDADSIINAIETLIQAGLLAQSPA